MLGGGPGGRISGGGGGGGRLFRSISDPDEIVPLVPSEESNPVIVFPEREVEGESPLDICGVNAEALSSVEGATPDDIEGDGVEGGETTGETTSFTEGGA